MIRTLKRAVLHTLNHFGYDLVRRSPPPGPSLGFKTIRTFKRAVLRTINLLGYDVIHRPSPPCPSLATNIGDGETVAEIGDRETVAEIGDRETVAEIGDRETVAEIGDRETVADAKRRLASAQSDINPDQPPLGTRWQPQADKIRKALDTLTGSTECLHYAQTQITFDHRESA